MLGVSIFTGIYYWIMKTDVGYGITHAIRQPLFSALFIGIIMGDLRQAIIIGAAVQILYIGLVAAGSNLPADDCLAGKTLNVTFVHMADRYAEEGNTRQIMLCNNVYPTILNLILRFPIPFLANYYGADAVNSFMESVPEWLTHGFSVAGGLLPALGFALTMFVIGKKELLPWFFIGYFLIQFSGIPVLGAAIFGLCAILLINMYQKASVEG